MPDHPMLADDRTSEWLGIRVHRWEFGHAVISMTLRDEMLNGFGIAHGGMVFSLADTCFAMACNDPEGDGSTITVAQGAQIDFVRSGRPGQVLTAEAKEVVRTGRSGLYDVTVTADDDVVAHFRGRSRTIPQRQKV